MTPLAYKTLGISLFGVAMVLAASIHSPARDSTGETQGSGELQGRARLSEHTPVQESTVPQKRSFSSRQTDHSTATRFKRNQKIQVTVGGQVRMPGPIQLPIGSRLLNAFWKAGGATEFGNARRVKLYRNGNSKSYNLLALEYQNVILEDGDTVDVPEKNVFGR